MPRPVCCCRLIESTCSVLMIICCYSCRTRTSRHIEYARRRRRRRRRPLSRTGLINIKDEKICPHYFRRRFFFSWESVWKFWYFALAYSGNSEPIKRVLIETATVAWSIMESRASFSHLNSRVNRIVDCFNGRWTGAITIQHVPKVVCWHDAMHDIGQSHKEQLNMLHMMHAPWLNNSTQSHAWPSHAALLDFAGRIWLKVFKRCFFATQINIFHTYQVFIKGPLSRGLWSISLIEPLVALHETAYNTCMLRTWFKIANIIIDVYLQQWSFTCMGSQFTYY